MANKTNRCIQLTINIVTAALIALPAHTLDTRNKFNSTNYEGLIDSTDVERIRGYLNTPDGSQWKALFESKSGAPRMIFGGDLRETEGKPEEIAYNFLQANKDIFEFQDVSNDLFLLKKTQSPGSIHITYQQQFKGLPVFDSTVGVHLNNLGMVELVTNDYKKYKKGYITKTPKILKRAEAVRIVELDLGQAIKYGNVETRIGFLKNASVLSKIYRIYYPTLKPFGDWLYDIDAHTGEIYRKINTIKSMNATGYIYTPNPLASPYRTVVKLTNLIPPKAGGKFTLNGLYFEITNKWSKPIQEDIPVFDYQYIFDDQLGDEAKDSDPHYEEVMAYYHMEAFRSYYRALGFQLFNSYKIKADAHGTENDNSWYSSFRKEIMLGDGGVNDGSDGDIILHELGHAVVDFIKPKIFFLTGEPAAMHEGYSDYFAASYFNDPCVAEWDSVSYSQTGCLRRVDNTKHYPEDTNGRPHSDGEIWSGALWDLRESLIEKAGEASIDIANTLTVKSIYYLPDNNVTFEEGAIALLIADNNLFHGKYNELIQKVFNVRGILDDITIYGQ